MYCSETPLLATARRLAIYGADATTYVERAKALASVLDPVGALPVPLMETRRGRRKSTFATKYDCCYGNAFNLAERFLNDDPSAKTTFVCNNMDCAERKSLERSVFEIPPRELFQEGLTNLSASVETVRQSFVQRVKGTCSEKCHGEGGFEFAIYSHVLINVVLHLMISF